jgi:hypothetical protein
VTVILWLPPVFVARFKTKPSARAHARDVTAERGPVHREKLPEFCRSCIFPLCKNHRRSPPAQPGGLFIISMNECTNREVLLHKGFGCVAAGLARSASNKEFLSLIFETPSCELGSIDWR